MILSSCVDLGKLGDRPIGNQTKAKAGKRFRLVEVRADAAMKRPHYFFIQEWAQSQWHDAQDVGYTDEEEAFVAFGRFVEASPSFGKYR